MNTSSATDIYTQAPALLPKKVSGLRCRECGKEYPVQPIYVCEYCFGPLELNYNYELIAKNISRQSIAEGPLNLWRYINLLPVEGQRLVSLHAGFTPLIPAPRLARKLGLRQLYIKNDSVNPTHSFKDRVVACAATKAVEFGFDTLSCASTGNLANATAAAAAKAGLKCYIFIPHDLELGKVLGTMVYGPELIKVRGTYDDVNRLCSEIAGRYRWAFVNVNIRPFYAEGSKTLAYETVEQLGWRYPDHVVVPIASGSLLTKIHKGFNEFYKVGLMQEAPRTRISGAQASGCSPVVQAILSNSDHIAPVKPNTIAKSLAIGTPADGYYAKEVVHVSGGAAAMVSDEEIVEGIELLAEYEGIFTETAGGVTIAVLKKLCAQGAIRPDELTVAYITGVGYKTQEAVGHIASRALETAANLQAFEDLKLASRQG